jgi:hypothetical protein
MGRIHRLPSRLTMVDRDVNRYPVSAGGTGFSVRGTSETVAGADRKGRRRAFETPPGAAPSCLPPF